MRGGTRETSHGNILRDGISVKELDVFLDELQSAFYSQDVDELLRRISLPLIVYSVAGVSVLRDRAEFTKLVTDYRAALEAMKVVRGVKSIESSDPVANNRQRVVVRNIDYNQAGQPVTSSLIRYFLVLKPEGYSIEMLEYIEAPVPLEVVEQLVH